MDNELNPINNVGNATNVSPVDSTTEETITISVERYGNLVYAEDVLNALEVAGVDNWEGYDIAMDYLENHEE